MNIRKTLSQIGFRVKKEKGQHFLQDEGVLQTILDHADLGAGDTVLEIGPGLGVLTEGLAAAGQVIAVETDPELCTYLTLRFADRSNVQIVRRDILKYNLEELPARKVKVVANLPYYISTPILMHLIGRVHRFSLILIMLQKELAERITAVPGTKKYGSLSIAVQFYTSTGIVAHVPKTSFYPAPEVDSAIVRLRVLDRPPVRVPDPEGFFRIVRAAFSQRRKTLRNALIGSRLFSKERLDAAFRTAEIDPTRRAETLSIEEFARLSAFLL
jgi:16S rRNA (adenine1518-N6/adenine1519-N6)-dimethyltransferase